MIKIKDWLKKNKDNIFIVISFLAFSIITAIITFLHEPWRDEAQSWLIARDLSIVEIVKQMKYEGHPCLWHFFIAIFAKLGLPYMTMNIISWTIMNISAFLVLKKAPFNKIIRLSILISMPFLYYYTSISRNYSIIPLIVILLAIYYTKRKEKPYIYGLLIALLSNTHILMLGMVGMIMLTTFIDEIIINRKTNSKEEKKNIIISLTIALIGVAITGFQLLGCLDACVIPGNKIDVIYTTKQTIERIPTILYREFAMMFTYRLEKSTYFAALIIVILVNLRYFPKQCLIFLGGLGFQTFVYLIIYKPSIIKVLLILIILLYCIWTQQYDYNEKMKKEKNKYKKIILISSIVIFQVYFLVINLGTLYKGHKVIIDDINSNYSCAKEISSYIKENIPEGTTIICMYDASSTSVIPYLKKYYFFNPITNKNFTYITWNLERVSQISNKDYIENIKRIYNNGENPYLIYTKETNIENITYLEDNKYITKIYETDKALTDESYSLYKINEKFKELKDIESKVNI